PVVTLSLRLEHHTDGREIKKRGIPALRVLQIQLCLPEFLVLHFQLYLVNSQLSQERLKKYDAELDCWQ
ncbi:MAG TPA: hypothetical protein VK435_04205, partial [Thermodesulfovibrionales bacterium]|nr:hypothetical protein [Thermodesulfovibrionales bacterium]